MHQKRRTSEKIFISILLRVTIMTMNGTRFPDNKAIPCSNKPREIYQYSNKAPRLLDQNCNF